MTMFANFTETITSIFTICLRNRRDVLHEFYMVHRVDLSFAQVLEWAPRVAGSFFLFLMFHFFGSRHLPSSVAATLHRHTVGSCPLPRHVQLSLVFPAFRFSRRSSLVWAFLPCAFRRLALNFGVSLASVSAFLSLACPFTIPREVSHHLPTVTCRPPTNLVHILHQSSSSGSLPLTWSTSISTHISFCPPRACSVLLVVYGTTFAFKCSLFSPIHLLPHVHRTDFQESNILHKSGTSHVFCWFRIHALTSHSEHYSPRSSFFFLRGVLPTFCSIHILTIVDASEFVYLANTLNNSLLALMHFSVFAATSSSSFKSSSTFLTPPASAAFNSSARSPFFPDTDGSLDLPCPSASRERFDVFESSHVQLQLLRLSLVPSGLGRTLWLLSLLSNRLTSCCLLEPLLNNSQHLRCFHGFVRPSSKKLEFQVK